MKKEIKPIIVETNVTGVGKPESNVHTYHTRFKFNAYSRMIRDEAPDVWQKAIMAILGVTEIYAFDHQGLYELTVKKATAYDWEEIEPTVLRILLERHERLSDPSSVDTLKSCLELIDKAAEEAKTGPNAVKA